MQMPLLHSALLRQVAPKPLPSPASKPASTSPASRAPPSEVPASLRPASGAVRPPSRNTLVGTWHVPDWQGSPSAQSLSKLQGPPGSTNPPTEGSAQDAMPIAIANATATSP